VKGQRVAGLPIHAPALRIGNNESIVEVGIGSYSRELDETGEPTEKIANKNDFHFCDSVRAKYGLYSGAGT
jgi:hypothetical protein